jgi:putative inorganic carbon (HCO3(-)) transporter
MNSPWASQDGSGERRAVQRAAAKFEWIWPLPLLVAGVAGVRDPLTAGVASLLALVPWIARLFSLGRLTRRTYFGGALGLLVAGGLVGLWAAYDPALSWPALLVLLGSVSLFFALANTLAAPRRVAGGLVIVAVAVALYFAAQYAHFDYPAELGRTARLGRAIGSLLPDLVIYTPHPNAVAAFLEGALVLSLALAWERRGGTRWVWGAAAAVIAYGLLISGSRGAWLGLLVALAIGLMLPGPGRAARLAVVGVALAGALLAAGASAGLVLGGRQVAILATVRESVSSRLALYRNSLYLLGDYPFTGIGPGDTFAMVYSRYQLLIRVPFLTYSHNLFLSMGLEHGATGLAALFWLLVGFYRFIARAERSGPGASLLSVFRAAWLGATVSLVHGLVDVPQLSGPRWTMPMLFALLGLAVAAGRPTLEHGACAATRAREPRRRLWIAAVLVTVLGLVGAFWRPLGAAWYANVGAVHQTRADLAPALSDSQREAAAGQATACFERALQLIPSQPVASRRLGMMALDRRDFDAAVAFLERAYGQEPGNQATLKALGYAYLWTGRLDAAAELLRRRDDLGEVVEELGVWSWWWTTQDREDLSAYAAEMVRRLSGAQQGP